MKDKLIIPNWPVLKQVKAFTTTNSMNLSLANLDRNKDINNLLSIINSKKINNIFWLQQVHGIDVVEIDENSTKNIKNTFTADAVFTSSKHTVCAVLTADCLPLLITNKNADKVAAIHAGWRGLAAGIIENTINKLQEDPKNLLVWLAPAIGPNKFEVGVDVKEAFLANAKNSQLVEASFIKLNNEKYLANLYSLAKERLLSLNVPLENIYMENYCTFTQEQYFHSYRRDKTTARMASIIWIE